MASTEPVPSDATSAALIPLGSHASAAPIEIKRPVTLVGSRKEIVRLHLQSSTVSNAHCCIVLNAWGCYVHDLGSRTGTLVNGKPVTDVDLADGDVLAVGRFQFRYRAPGRTRPKPLPLPPAELVVSTLSGPLTILKRVLVIGRRDGSDVQFDDSRVSNVHALLIEQDGRRLIRDLGSRTGTWLDDKPVHQDPLPDGEPFRVGGATLTVTPRPTAATALARGPAEPIPLDEADLPEIDGLDAAAAGGVDVSSIDALVAASLAGGGLAAAGPEAVAADALELEPLGIEPLEREPDDTVPADDDLASLRRGWKTGPRVTAPAEPAEPGPHKIQPAKPEIQVPVAEARPARPPTPRAPKPGPVPPAPLELSPAPAGLPTVPPPARPAVPVVPPPLAETPPVDRPGEYDDVPPSAKTPTAPAEVAPAPIEPAGVEVDEFELTQPGPAELELSAATAAPPDLAPVDLTPADAPVADPDSPAARAADLVPPSDPDAPAAPLPADAALDLEAADLDPLDLPPLDLGEIDLALAAPADPAPTITRAAPRLDLDPFPAVPAAEMPAAEAESAAASAEVAPADPAPADVAQDEPLAVPVDEADVVEPAPDSAEAAADLAAMEEAEVEAEAIELERLDLAPAADAVETSVAGPPASADAVAAAAAETESIAAESEPSIEAAGPVAESPDDQATPVPLEESGQVTVPADAEVEEEDHFEPLDLGDVHLIPDADAPAAARAPSAEPEVDIDALRPDPEAPVAVEEPADVAADLSPQDEIASGLESPLPDEISAESADIASQQTLSDTAAPVSDTPQVGPQTAVTSGDAIGKATDEVENELEVEAQHVPTSRFSSTAASAETADGIDLVDLNADTEEEDDTPATAGEGMAGQAVVVDEATPPVPTAVPLDRPLPADASVVTLPLDRADDAQGVLSRSLDVPDEAAPPEPAPVEPAPAVSVPPAAFLRPIEPEPVPEPDLVRLSEDADDETNDATALAVDLGLILDEDAGPETPPVTPAPAAGPAEPVEIDLSTATPRRPDAAGHIGHVDFAKADAAEAYSAGSIDLSGLGPADAPAFGTYAAAGPAAAHDEVAEDLFDADGVEVVEPEAATDDAIRFDPPPRPAGTVDETIDPDAHIDPPQSGSLADLMPGGPPLLGGSFMSMPPQFPPEAPAPGRRRPLRVGFGAEARASRPAPFAAERTIADALGGSAPVDEIDSLDAPAHPDGLNGSAANGAIHGGVNDGPAGFEGLDTASLHTGTSIDAFSSAHAAGGFGEPPRVDVSSESAEALPADTLLAPAERQRPRGVIRPMVPSAGTTEDAVTVVAVAASAEADRLRARKHKRRVRRVIALIVAMLVLAGGAAWGVYYYTPLKSTVDALISFDGLDRLGVEEATQFRVRQNETLVSETVRAGAVTSLPPAVPAGFLADGKRLYDAVSSDPKVRWPADQPTALRLRVRSTDKENDVTRLRALANELVKAGDADRAESDRTRDRIREDSSDISQKRRLLSDVNDQLQALQQATANHPELRNLSELNAEYLAAEPALTSIKSKRQELEAAVERLSRPAPAASTTAPAADPATADEELAGLTKQLADLQQASRPNTDGGGEARKQLDVAIARFDEDLAKAQKLRDNPQLAAYIDSAKRMFGQFRQMTEDLIRRQENNRAQLSDLKSKMSDNMQALTADRLAKDADLKKLKDQLAIGERQYNAAVASGYADEAKKSELMLRVLKIKIAEQEDKFKADSVYGPAITEVQKMIDRQESDISADRRNSDERLTALQADFTRTSPSVEQLPAEQKALAEGIEKKLAEVNDARRAYDAAAEKAQTEQAKIEADTREKTAALRLQIASRRQDVLAAFKARQAQDDETTRQKRLSDTQAQLNDVRTQEQAAQHRLADAAAAIESAEKLRRSTAQADTERTARLADRDNIERGLRSVQSSLATRQAQLARLIVADRKVELQSYDDPDRRPLYAAVAAAAIIGLTLIPILLDLLALAHEAHPHEPVTDDAEASEGFEPLLGDNRGRKALPEPASV